MLFYRVFRSSPAPAAFSRPPALQSLASHFSFSFLSRCPLLAAALASPALTPFPARRGPRRPLFRAIPRRLATSRRRRPSSKLNTSRAPERPTLVTLTASRPSQPDQPWRQPLKQALRHSPAQRASWRRSPKSAGPRPPSVACAASSSPRRARPPASPAPTARAPSVRVLETPTRLIRAAKTPTRRPPASARRPSPLSLFPRPPRPRFRPHPQRRKHPFPDCPTIRCHIVSQIPPEHRPTSASAVSPVAKGSIQAFALRHLHRTKTPPLLLSTHRPPPPIPTAQRQSRGPALPLLLYTRCLPSPQNHRTVQATRPRAIPMRPRPRLSAIA